MTRYLIAIHHPDNYDPSREDEAMHRDIDALNDEMVAAGVSGEWLDILRILCGESLAEFGEEKIIRP